MKVIKFQCPYCKSYIEIDKKVNFCYKYGNHLNEIIKEIEKYKYPDIKLIHNEIIKNAILNIPNSGVLNIPIGLDNNNWLYYDITKMPNLLIGGTVMSGKTNIINLILLSLISKYSPEKIRIILADSKGVDYSYYNKVPHLLIPVINSVESLETILKNEIYEMNSRYSLLNSVGLKNILDYNKLREVSKIPYHLIFIDDYTIFANSYENNCKFYIETLAQNCWNFGIHLIIVANHPTVNELTTISRFNFPTRISFRVISTEDSRLVLEAPGAEKLSGIGNALLNSPSIINLKHLHVDKIEDNDIYAIINDLNNKNEKREIFNKFDIVHENSYNLNLKNYNEEPLYNEIVKFVMIQGKASASLLQRRFRLGYNRAAHAIDLLEENGIIGPQNGSKPRKALIVLNSKEKTKKINS